MIGTKLYLKERFQCVKIDKAENKKSSKCSEQDTSSYGDDWSKVNEEPIQDPSWIMRKRHGDRRRHSDVRTRNVHVGDVTGGSAVREIQG